MHEMSLAEGIVQLVEEAARNEGSSRVRAVWLEIGRLASVETEALRFCFDVVTRGGVAEGARLEIVDLPGQAWCMQCAQQVEITEQYAACPRCGSYQLQVTGGNEMRVRELEVE